MSKNPTMTPREATLLAAEFIAAHPRRFDFMTCRQPSSLDCKTPACALGWIAVFAGLHPNDTDKESVWDGDVVGVFMKGKPFDGYDRYFYERMNGFDPHWDTSAARCARAMLLFADAEYGVTP